MSLEGVQIGGSSTVLVNGHRIELQCQGREEYRPCIPGYSTSKPKCCFLQAAVSVKSLVIFYNKEWCRQFQLPPQYNLFLMLNSWSDTPPPPKKIINQEMCYRTVSTHGWNIKRRASWAKTEVLRFWHICWVMFCNPSFFSEICKQCRRKLEEASQLIVFPNSESTTEALEANVDEPEEHISENIAQVYTAIWYSHGMNKKDYTLSEWLGVSKRRVFLPLPFADPSPILLLYITN